MDLQIKILKNFFNDSNLKIYRESGKIIVVGDIIVFDNKHEEIPVKIHKVIGNIKWHGDIN